MSIKIVNDFSEPGSRIARVIKNPKGEDIPVYEITTFHTLTQFVGFAKYINRKDGNVYYRGQSELHKSIYPSIFRGTTNFDSRYKKYYAFIKSHIMKSRYVNYWDDDVVLPLLQHYGVKTDWLDIVDNLWVAIWFGLHDFNSLKISNRHYVNIVPREISNNYSYVLLICSDATVEDTSKSGVYYGDTTKVVDLRKACPSVYLRPHAQHALLMRYNKCLPEDYMNQVVGIAQISVENGFKWVGNEGLMSIQSLFPPVNYDCGYRNLLQDIVFQERQISSYGSIQMISY